MILIIILQKVIGSGVGVMSPFPPPYAMKWGTKEKELKGRKKGYLKRGLRLRRWKCHEVSWCDCANLEYDIANVVRQVNGLHQIIYVAAGSRRNARLKADERVRATAESVSLWRARGAEMDRNTSSATSMNRSQVR